MKLCIIYTNCQGCTGINYFLSKSINFCNIYEIKCIENYSFIKNQCEIPIDLFNNCDLFIYQPINDVHGSYSTNNIIKLLKDNCIKISFPYIYNTSFYTIYHENSNNFIPHDFDASLLLNNNNKIILDKFIGHGILDIFNKKYNEHKDINSIINDYINNNIQFDFKYRFDKCMEILMEKEKYCDIKVSSYIFENYKTKILFLTHNHPTTYILLYITNEILKRLNLEIISGTKFLLNESNLSYDINLLNIDKYNKTYYDFNFNTNDELISDLQNYNFLNIINDNKTINNIKNIYNVI